MSVLLSLLLLAPVGALAAVGRFDGLYGQDSFAYYDYAVGPLRESLLRLAPLPPFFWPPGYPLLVAIASLAVGPLPLAGQLVSMLAGGLVPVFTAWLACEVWIPDDQASEARTFVPMVAGILTALTGQLWQSSAVVMADTTGLAAATLGVSALARYGRLRKPGWLILASAALSWALLTRWIYGLVAVPCVIYVLAIWAQSMRQGAALREASFPSLVAMLAAVIVLSPMLNSLATQWRNPTGDAASFAGDLDVYEWHPLNALRREFNTTDGRLSYRLPNGIYFAVAPAHRFYFTPLVAPFIVPGLWAVARRRTLAPVLLLVGWAAAVYGFHAGAPWQNFRFTLAYLPPLAVLVAVGFAQVHQALGQRAGWPKRLAQLLRPLVVLGLAWMAVGGVELTQRFIARKAGELGIVRRVEAQMPPDARLLTFNLTSTFRHYSRIETLELYELSRSNLSGLLADTRPAYLLLDVAGVEAQWRGQSPSENYHWLRDGQGLEVIEQLEAYTLFKVQ